MVELLCAATKNNQEISWLLYPQSTHQWVSPCVCILNKKETREEYYVLPTLSATSKNLEGSGNLKEDMAALLSPS